MLPELHTERLVVALAGSVTVGSGVRANHPHFRRTIEGLQTRRARARDRLFDEEDVPGATEPGHDVLGPLEYEAPTQMGQHDQRGMRHGQTFQSPEFFRVKG